jgi:hypothetical protein
MLIIRIKRSSGRCTVQTKVANTIDDSLNGAPARVARTGEADELTAYPVFLVGEF